MKQFSKVLIVLLVAVIVIFGFSYKYRNHNIANNIQLTTAQTLKQESTSRSERVIILEDKENDYRLSADNESVYLYYNGFEKEFPEWHSAINQETPEIYCKNYDDSDDEKELMIKLYSHYDSQLETKLYNLAFIKLVEQDNGEKEFYIVSNSEETWKKPFSNSIRTELTQLKSCKKFIQFVMDDATESIIYDEKTGITTNEHVWFSKAYCGPRGQYYTLEKWTKGNAVFGFEEDGTPTVDIQILAYYEEVEEPQLVGHIHSNIRLFNNELKPAPYTIYFQTQSGFEVSDPRKTAKSDWTVKVKNISETPTMTDNNIDWIDNEFEISSLKGEQNIYFNNLSSKIKLVDSIKFTQKDITLVARDGCSFSSGIASSGSYSVVINDGEKENANIAYKCEVKEVKGKSTLVITLDKTYDKEDIEKLTVKFGV